MIAQRARQLVTSAAGTVFGGRAVAQAGIFVVSVAPVLVLDDATFNDFTVVVTVVVLVVVAPVGAFQQHLARSGSAGGPIGATLRMNTTVALVLTVVAMALAAALAGRHPWIAVIGMAAVVMSSSLWLATMLALRQQFGRSAAVEAIGGFAVITVSAVLVALSAGVAWWAVAYTTGPLAALVAGLVLVTRRGGAQPVAPAELAPLATLVRGAGPLFVIGFLAMAYNRTDLLILSTLAPEAETTSYAVAGRLVGPLLIGLGSLNNSLYPQLLAARSEPQHMLAVARRYGRLLSLGCIVAAPLVVGLVLVLGALNGTFGGLDLAVPVALLALAIVPFAGAVPFGFLLTAIGIEWWWMVLLAASLVIDAVAVATFAHDATTCAAVWLVVQCVLWVVTRIVLRSSRFTTALNDTRPHPADVTT